MEIELPNNINNHQIYPLPIPPLYHEQQRKRLSVLHSLNSLFQERTFTESRLNEIADRDPGQCCSLPSCIFMRHRTALIGSYDLYIVNRALRDRGKYLLPRDPQLQIRNINLNPTNTRLMGILLSVKYIIGPCIHWFAIRCVNGQWYNFDSKLPFPEPFINITAVYDFLDAHSHQHGTIYFVMNELQP